MRKLEIWVLIEIWTPCAFYSLTLRNKEKNV